MKPSWLTKKLIGLGLALAIPVIGNTKHSQRITQDWEFLQGDIGGVWEVLRAKENHVGAPEDVPLWTKITLPHCFNATDAVDPDKAYYQGPGWYRTTLEINNPFENGRTLLHFEGAGQKTDVYVGLVHAGSHVGGYDEWTVDITDAIKKFYSDATLMKKYQGKVPVIVRCDNSRDLEMIPSDLSDFNVYGGLYRYVNLEYVPALSLESIGIITDHSHVTVGTSLRNETPASEATVEIEIHSPEGSVVARESKTIDPRMDGTDQCSFQVKKPLLWSPDAPNLYTCVVRLKSDAGTSEKTEIFGFRNFEFMEHGPFKLNGERLLLRGTHRHEDHAGVAAAMTEEMIRTEMEMMKEMGVNFIRLGHYQQSRIVLEQCDRLGILVWEEIPWCRGGVGSEVYKEQGRRMLTNMIQQHRNHPSVIIWGLGNENDWPGDQPEYDAAAVRAYMTELNDLAHELDPTRKTAIRRCEPCMDVVDVYSPSIWAGWYRGKFTSYQEYTKMAVDSVDHFLHVEWGASHHARRHSEDPDCNLDQIAGGKGADERAGDASLHGGPPRVSKDGDWSETYACNLIDWHLKEQENMPYLTGTAYWPFKDFSTPIRPENPVPYMNQKGVVERDFTKKESFYVFQSYWTEKPMIHIYGHTWPTRWGDVGEGKMVKVYSNCEEVELFVNGASLGVRKRDSQDYPAAGLRWKVKFAGGRNDLKAVGTRNGQKVEDKISPMYETRKWEKPTRMVVTSHAAEEADMAWVDVQLNDQNNVPCLDAKNVVRFSLVGDGALIENLGTSTGSRTVEACNGVARIRVKLNAATSIVAVKSEGLATQFITLAPVSFNLVEIERSRILKKAARYLQEEPRTITATPCERSQGGLHDFYSEGDYWWPNPDDPADPYIRRDGETNPGNFVAHREAMARLSDTIGTLVSAYLITGDEQYAKKAVRHLKAWFVDGKTRMNPSLLYGQAIKGLYTGRSIGVIDTIHLTEVARGAKLLCASPSFAADDQKQVKAWFREYLTWLNTHEYGTTEKVHPNNHGVCWSLQVAAFADLLGDAQQLELIRTQFKTVYLAAMMDKDGGFPAELKRTKPYGYSLFVIDAMAGVAQIASGPDDNLWTYELPDGRGMKKGMQFIYPYIKDKSSWPLKPDVLYWDEWPVRQPSLLFAGVAFGNPGYLATWERHEADPTTFEVLRNLPLRHPLLWIK